MLHQNTSKTLYTLLFVGVFIMSITLTWNFLSSFLPADPPWLRPAAFVCFEGGLLVWSHIHKYTAENVQRHHISGTMTFICLAACGTATFYEIAHGIHSLGFIIPPAVAAIIPWCVIGVMGSELAAVTLYFFADPIYHARRQFLDKHGETKQFHIAPIQMQQTGELPAPSSTVVEPGASSQSGLRQKLANLIAGAPQPSPVQQIAAPVAIPPELVAALEQYMQQRQTNVQEPLNLPDPEQFANDLAASIGGAAASPLPQAAPKGPQLNGK